MNEKWNRLSKPTKLLIIAPLAILGMAFFIFIGGTVVMLLWNALLPPLFSFPAITFWQALGILLLCRILFGGLGMRGGRQAPRRVVAPATASPIASLIGFPSASRI